MDSTVRGTLVCVNSGMETQGNISISCDSLGDKSVFSVDLKYGFLRVPGNSRCRKDVSQFYDEVHAQFGILCDNQEYYFEDERLFEGRMLFRYGISLNETIELRVCRANC